MFGHFQTMFDVSFLSTMFYFIDVLIFHRFAGSVFVDDAGPTSSVDTSSVGEEVVFREVDDRFLDGWNGRGHGRGFRLENREERTD